MSLSRGSTFDPKDWSLPGSCPDFSGKNILRLTFLQLPHNILFSKLSGLKKTNIYHLDVVSEGQESGNRLWWFLDQGLS